MSFLSCFRVGRRRAQPKKLDDETSTQLKYASYNPSLKITAFAIPSTHAVSAAGSDAAIAVNEALINLAQQLSTQDGGWGTSLSEACLATCEHLGAAHACVYVLSKTDLWAASAASAGVGAADALGRALSADPLSNASAAAAVMGAYKESSQEALVFCDASAAARSGGCRDSSSSFGGPLQLPSDWRVLRAGHGCRQFAAVGCVGPGGELL
ncbi:hypothetical protein Agub_g13460, partial [Astrephomene gubernaculifera]